MGTIKDEEEYCWALHNLCNDEEYVKYLNNCLSKIEVANYEYTELLNRLFDEQANYHDLLNGETIVKLLGSIGITEGLLFVAMTVLKELELGVPIEKINNGFMLGTLLALIVIPLIVFTNNSRFKKQLNKSTKAVLIDVTNKIMDFVALYDRTEEVLKSAEEKLTKSKERCLKLKKTNHFN